MHNNAIRRTDVCFRINDKLQEKTRKSTPQHHPQPPATRKNDKPAGELTIRDRKDASQNNAIWEKEVQKLIRCSGLNPYRSMAFMCSSLA